jgi:hypothetical protein
MKDEAIGIEAIGIEAIGIEGRSRLPATLR